MVEIRAVQKVLIVGIFLIFLIGTGLVLLSGSNVLDAASWSFLNIIGGTFPLNPVLVDESNLLVLLSQISGVLGNVIFTILVTTIFYQALGRVDFRRAYAKSRLRLLSNHIIITPVNSLGMGLAERLDGRGIRFVMVDANKKSVGKAMSNHMLSVEGDAVVQDTLKQAHVENAYALVTLGENDIDNMLVAITAKRLNPRLRIISRVSDVDNVSKLERAGAKRVMFPESVVGSEIGNFLLATV